MISARSQTGRIRCSSLFAGLLLLAGFSVVVVHALVGCVSARRAEPLSGPLETNLRVAKGQQHFMRHCNQCHPGGDAGLGPAINNKPLPGFMIKTQVRLGVGKMPGFSREEINPKDLNDLVVYLKAQRRR